MQKREIASETRKKVIKTAIDILRMHGSIAGDRMCQDWSDGSANNPANLFTDHERDDLEYNHQIRNSRLDDYEQGIDFFGDEMSVSFTMADALQDMLDDECETMPDKPVTHKIVNSLGVERGRGSLEECNELRKIADCADHYVVPIND